MNEQQKRIGKEPFHGHSSIKSSLTQEAFQLVFPLGKSIEARIENDGDVVPGRKARFAQAPAFPEYSPRPVPSDGVRIGMDGNENRPARSQAVRQDVYPHAFARKSDPAREDLLDLRALSNAVRLGKPLPGDIGTSSPQDRISRASFRRRR